MKRQIFGIFQLYLTTFFCFLVTLPVYSQITERVYKSDYRIDPEKKGELSVELDNISFFKNNEFSGNFLKGYTLPGFWLQTKAVYYPLENIKLEAGAHMLRFWGANKYPNFAYQDISTWKGNQFQSGFHILPYLRAQIALSDHVDIILGNIYGGANHYLIEPLYNPELNLIADPEAGVQLLYRSKFIDADIWANWESFIFKLDTHQEAFTFGLSTCFKYNNEEAPVHFYSPLQVLAQHRGGEIDTILTNSVQTLMNGAVGVGAVWNINHRIIKNINIELDAIGYYQQAGELWLFDSGYGLFARASADIQDFRIKAGYWMCEDFISMFGSPFYGAVSTSKEDFTFEKPKMTTLGLEYSRSFGKGYSLGIDMDLYQHFSSTVHTPEGSQKQGSSTSFTVGIYFRINPSFIIKHF